MNIFPKIKELCKPFASFEFVKAVFVYGSAVRTKKALNDIDIIILLDDTLEIDEKESQKVEILTKLIEQKAKKYKLKVSLNF